MTARLLSDARWRGTHGIGRFAVEVLSRLPAHAQICGGPRPLSAMDPAWLEWQVVTRRPRVFFSPGFNPPPLCPAALVFTLHDLVQIQMPGVATPFKRAYYEWIVRPACRRAFRVLTVSEYSRSAILAWSGLPDDRVVNVGNGVGPNFSCEGKRHTPGFRYILYAGNTRPHKNVDRLLTAFRQLTDKGVRLLMTGNREPSIAGRVERFGVPARTRFAGAVTDVELARLYRGAELVAVPSLAEGFGLPALEAMACGAPVVAADATSLPEVVGPAGLLVDPFDATDIQRGMERVLSDGGLRASMRALGIARARQFDWDRVALRVWSILRQAGWN